MGDVVAGDVEGLAVVGHAPDDDVGVEDGRVVVIDRDPPSLVPRSASICFIRSRVVVGIGELDAVLGRHDEAELVTVLAAAFDERATIFHIPFGRIDLALLAVLRHAVSLEIAQVSVDRLGADESAAARRPTLGLSFTTRALTATRRASYESTIPAPGAPVLQRRRDRRATATLVEPAASLPCAVQAERIASCPADSLLDLSRKADRTSADTTHAASGRSLTTLVADLARTESKVVVVVCHGMTIGSRAQACKRQTARVGA